MKNSKLKKTDFIRSSKKQKLTQSVLRMVKVNWSKILNNPNLLDVENFSNKQLETLASMNMDEFVKVAIQLNKPSKDEDDLRYVFTSILKDIKEELKKQL